MRKVAGLSVVLILTMGIFTSCAKQYPHKVETSMKSLKTAVGDLKKAIEVKDYTTIKEQFQKIGVDISSLNDVDPILGTKAEWLSNHSALVEETVKGMAAADLQDDAAIQTALDNIFNYMKSGHKIFKK